MRPSGRLELATEAMGNHLPLQPQVPASNNMMSDQKRREPEGPANPSSSDDQRSSKGGPDLECVLCGERANDKTNLERHLLTHTDFGYFTCSRCSDNFVEKNQYEEHMATHHPSASTTPGPSGDGQDGSSLKCEPATTTNRHDVIVIGDDSDNEDSKCASGATVMDQGSFQCESESQLKIVNTMTLNPDVRSAPIVIDDDDDDDASSTSTVEWKGNIGDEDNLDKSLDEPQDPQDKVPDGDADPDVADKTGKDDKEIIPDPVVQQEGNSEGRSGISDEKSVDSDTQKPDRKLESGDLNLDVDLSEAFSDSDCLQIADYFMVVSETSRDGEDADEDGNAVPQVEKPAVEPSETAAESNRVEAGATADDALAEASSESGKQQNLKRARSESPSQLNPEPKRTETS